MTTNTTNATNPYLDEVKGDWDVTDPGDWKFRSTIDAFNGYHSSGGIYRQYRTVTTDWCDFAPGDEICSMSDLAQDYEDAVDRGAKRRAAALLRELEGFACWWHKRLLAAHNYQCLYEELTPEKREALPDAEYYGDFDAYADECRAALDAYEQHDE